MRCGGVLPAVNSVPNHRAQRNALFGLASCLGAVARACGAAARLAPLALRLGAGGDHGEPYPFNKAWSAVAPRGKRWRRQPCLLGAGRRQGSSKGA